MGVGVGRAAFAAAGEVRAVGDGSAGRGVGLPDDGEVVATGAAVFAAGVAA